MEKAIYTIPTTTVVEFKTERIMAMADRSAHQPGGQNAPERSSKVF
jgi:hypothetical protein